MPNWYDVTRNPEYQSLPEVDRLDLKKTFFNETIGKDPEFSALDDTTKQATWMEFMQSPDDTGEGALTSAASSFARGALRPLSDVPIAVGALTGSEGIEKFGKGIQEGVESRFPVNPIQEGFFTTEIPGVAGQVASMLAGGGAGAVGVKALGGTAKAAQLGAKTAVGTQAFAGGTAGGASSADVLGLKGGERIARSLLGGVTELASEAIPFGMGAETGLVRNLLGESVESGAGRILTSGATEAAEEGFAETAGQATDIAFRPEQASMDLSQIGKAMLLGGAGGVLMGGINSIGRQTPLESQTPVQQSLAAEINAIPTDLVPDQTDDEKLVNMNAGGTTVVDPQGKTAVIAPPAPEPPSQIIPKELVVKANETSPDVSSSTTAFVELNENLLKTQVEGAADKAAQMLAQEQAAQAQAAAERQAQLEAPTPEQPLAQEPQAPVGLPAEPAIEPTVETPSPAMEQIEAPVPPPTAEAGAGVGEAIIAWKGTGKAPSGAASSGLGFFATNSKEYAKQYAADDAGLKQVSVSIKNPYLMGFDEFRSIDRGLSDKSAKEISSELRNAGHDGIIVTQNDGSKEYIAFSKDQIANLPETAPKNSSRKPVLAPQAQEMLAQAAAINAGTQTVAPSTNEFVQKMTGQAAPPITPTKETPTPAAVAAKEAVKAAGGAKAVRLVADDGRQVIVARDPEDNSAWRATLFVNGEPINHELFGRRDDAIRWVFGDERTQDARWAVDQKPITPQGAAPTPATEGTVMPGGSAMERDAGSAIQPQELPPIPEGHVRLTHSTSPASIEKILASKKFNFSGTLDSTTDSFSNNNDVALRLNTGKAGAMSREKFGNKVLIIDLPFDEYRRLRQLSQTDDQIPGDKFVAVYDTQTKSFSSSIGQRAEPSFQATQVATPTETAAPLAKEAAVASVVQQPAEGSIPAVEQESAITAIESNEKADIADAAMAFLEEDLTESKRQWSPEKIAAAKAYFASGGKDTDVLRAAFPKLVGSRPIVQAYLKADKDASEAQAKRDAADAKLAKEIERDEKEQAKAEEAQRKREELNIKTLNSLIQKTRTNVVQGTVKPTDANQAVAILNSSGEIPNVLFTWIGTSKDFLADPANRVRYPETWAAVSANSKIEGMSENGQPIVFTDNVGVSDLDRKLANLQGTTPEVAAVRRVILHENIHKGMFFLSMKEKMQIFSFLRRMYSPQELDSLAESYSEYADWRTNQVSYFSILEEAMTRDFDSMAEIPRDGILAEFMQFLRGIWQKITGKTSEPTLKDYKDVFRLIRNSLKNSEKANADMLVNGGGVRMSMSEFLSNVTPEQDAEYMAAVEAGNVAKQQAMVDAAAKAAGYDVRKFYHGTPTGGFTEFRKDYQGRTGGRARGGFSFTTKREAAKTYATGFSSESVALDEAIRIANKALSEIDGKPGSMEPFIKQGYEESDGIPEFYWGVIDDNAEFAESLRELARYYDKTFPETASSLLQAASAATAFEGMPEVFTVFLKIPPSSPQFNATPATLGSVVSSLDVRNESAGAAIVNMPNQEVVAYVANPNQIKSADPVTRDEQGNVIPLSRRFQSASNDIRFSKVTYDSPNDAAFNSGAEVARNTDYDERDKEVRSTIRAAYDIAPKTNGPSVPLDELFSIVQQSMPDLTETEFSRILQGLYEDSGALLIEGESPFATFTTEGERAGSVIVMPPSGFQTRAMASMVDPEDAATKQFAKNIKDINSGTAKAAFDGVQFVDFEPVDHIVKPNKSYEKIAIDYVDGLLGEGKSIEDIATSIMTPMFFDSIGISNDVKARQALTSEVLRRVTDLNGLSNTRLASKRLQKLEDLISAFWQGLGTESGGNQGQRAFIIGSPRYSWMFLKDSVKKEMKERRNNILTVQFGNNNATSFTQNSYENADKASTMSADEIASDIEDFKIDQDLLDGEATLTGKLAKMYEELKDLLRENGILARLDAQENITAKASISPARREELAALSKDERAKLRDKNNKRIEQILNTLLGKEEDADTTEKKTVRKKREKMVDAVKKRVEQGKPIEPTDYVPIITENPQRDEIIDDVSNALLQAAKKRGVKPSQKTALADLVASIKSLLKRNIKGEDLKADEAPLGQLLARTYLDNLTATEAKLFTESWNDGRKKVRAMLTEMGVEGTQLEAELNAIMPATPTIAYNPSAVRKAITRALREAGLDANDLLANTQSVKSEILKVWDNAAVDAGLTPSVWQEGRKLAEKSIDEFVIERKASKEKAKKIAKVVSEQANNPVSLADFSNSLSQYKLNDGKVKELFDKAKVLANKKVQIAYDMAVRVLLVSENNLAQSAFFNSATKPDTIVKAFRQQVSDPMSRQDFKDRMEAMKVSGELADRLFDRAAREKDNAQWKRAQDMLEGPNALRNILREINRARPGNQAPLSEQIPWRQLLSQSSKTVEEYRQRILDAISANESLKNATPEQKARLAELFTEAWETKRKRILDSMQERLIREQEAKGNLSKKAAKALQENRMRIVEDINLGIFDNDEIAKIIAEKFGIKSEFTDEERQKIESLIAILQDEKLNRVKRNKAAYELLETLSAQTDISIAKLLSNFWVSSVLSGMNTVFSIGMSVFSGMGELTTALSRIFSAAFSNPKQLSSEVAAAFKTLARVISAVPRQANRAWQYLVTGDQAFLDPSMNDALKNMDYASIGKNNQLAEQMAKSDKILEKSMGLFMRTISRLLTALDLFNSGLTKEGSLSIVFRQLDLDPAKIQMLEKKSDLKAYKDQVIRDYFNNVQPKTLNEKALVESYAMAEMMKALDEIGNVSENADQMAMQGAMTLDPSGLGGYGYRFVKSMMKSAESGTDKLLERNLRKWDEAVGVDEKAEAGVKLVLSYIFQFAAYNAANLVGVRFARFAGNKFNQSLSFLPLIGVLRLYEAEFDSDRIRGKEAFTDMIKRNQLTGVIAAVIGYYVLKAIAEEPDDEKRGAFINGGWSNLTPEKKQQKIASGQKEYTLGFGDTVINYGNWPGSGILAAIGGLSDLIRFSPDQWNDKTVANKLLSATTSGVFSAMEVPALSQFQELFGSSLSSKDPNEQKLTKFARVIGNYVGGFVPRILKDIDYISDPNFRKYETLWEKTASHIPVYRRYEGKEYYDILGQQIQRNVYPGSREFMVKPTDPAYKVLGALNSRGIWLTPANAEHRMVGKGARRRSLTQEEADNYSLETGKGYKQMLLRYGQRALQMPTERARAFLLDKADEVRDRALKKVYRGYQPAT